MINQKTVLFSEFNKERFLNQIKLFLPAPNRVDTPPELSLDTNCPTSVILPCGPSANSFSLTMIWSSRTTPHWVHTASPLEGSVSISVDPQFLHLFADICKVINSINFNSKPSLKNVSHVYKQLIFKKLNVLIVCFFFQWKSNENNKFGYIINSELTLFCYRQN